MEPIDGEESILSALVSLRAFCAANGLPAAERLIAECLGKCEELYVEKRRTAFNNNDADSQ